MLALLGHARLDNGGENGGEGGLTRYRAMGLVV